VLPVLFLQPCSDRPDLEVLSWQSYSACHFLPVLFCLPSSSCRVPAVFSFLSSPGCPVLAVSSGSPVLAALFCQSCSASPVLTFLSFLPCPGCLILAVLPCLCSGIPVNVNQWIDGQQFNKDFMIDYRYYQSKRTKLLPMNRYYRWSA
jgi:hypothetical protein